jgi:hypothetical protein
VRLALSMIPPFAHGTTARAAPVWGAVSQQARAERPGYGSHEVSDLTEA